MVRARSLLWSVAPGLFFMLRILYHFDVALSTYMAYNLDMKTKSNNISRSYQLPGLRRERKARTLSQEELATLSGVSRPTIARIELGTTGAYRSTVDKLARGLKVGKGRLMV